MRAEQFWRHGCSVPHGQAVHLRGSRANADSSLPLAWPGSRLPEPVSSSSAGAHYIFHTSFPSTNTSNTMGSAGLGVQVAGLLVPPQPGSAAELSSPLGPLKAGSLLCHLVQRCGSIPRCALCCLQNLNALRFVLWRQLTVIPLTAGL